MVGLAGNGLCRTDQRKVLHVAVVWKGRLSLLDFLHVVLVVSASWQLRLARSPCATCALGGHPPEERVARNGSLLKKGVEPHDQYAINVDCGLF